MGPNLDYSYEAPAGSVPATANSDIKLVWDSESFFGSGSLSRQQTPNGGSATPIVYQDRIYLWWHMPSLEADLYDPTPVTRKVPEEYTSFSSLYRLIDNAVTSVNNITCIDPLTGKTIWERTFNLEGLFNTGHKENVNNQTMAAADGKVFAVGTDQRIYALDAVSGALLWVSKNASFASTHETRVEGMALLEQYKSDRDFNNHLLVADDTLIAGDNRNWGTLSGYDLDTGALLWRLGGLQMGRYNPDIWVHNGKSYVIASGNSSFTLIDPADGSVLWTQSGVGIAGGGASVQGDYFFTNTDLAGPGETDVGTLGCFQLSLSGPTLLWNANPSRGFPRSKNAGVFLHDGKVFLRANNQCHVYSLTDGNLITSLPLLADINSEQDDQAIVYRINNLLYQIIDSQHSSYEHAVVDMDSNQVVGRFTLSTPGLSYSSFMIPVPYHGDLLLKKAYGRLSRLTFSEQPTTEVSVQLKEPIAVVARNETASFTAEVTTLGSRSVSEVQFFIDGQLESVDDQAPYEFSPTLSQADIYQVKAVAIDDLGQSYESHSRLLDVVDWEVILLPGQLDIQLGESRRLIPLAINKKTGYFLPQRFQAVPMGYEYDNTHDPVFAPITLEDEHSMRDKASYLASNGTVEIGTSINEGGRIGYYIWGSYTPSATGEQLIQASITHDGVTRSATSIARVFAPGEKISQRNLEVLEQPVRVVDGKFFLSSAWSSHASGAIYTLLSGPADPGNTPTFPRWEATAAGKVTYQVYHPGNDRYLPSEPVTASFLVRSASASLLPQSITFDPIPDKAPSSAPFAVFADSPSSEPVTIKMISGPAYLGENNTVYLTGKKGVVSILAEHEGDWEYAAALPVIREFYVRSTTSIDLELRSPEPGAVFLEGQALNLSVWVDSPLSPVTQVDYLLDGQVATSALAAPWNGTLNNPVPGSYTLQARATNQDGEVEYSAQIAIQITGFDSILVTPAALTLILGGEQELGAIALDAQGSPMPGVFQPQINWVTSLGTLSGSSGNSTVFSASEVGTGSITVSATVGGVYREVSIPVEVLKMPQSINFPDPGFALLTEGPLPLVASSTSGLPVSFSVISGPGFIQNGNELVGTAAGTVVVQAEQPGDATWAPAAPVQREITVKDGIFLTALSLSPSAVEVIAEKTQAFSWTATDQDGDAIDPGLLSVQWALSGGGSVDTNGVFTASTVPGGPYTLTLTVGYEGIELQQIVSITVKPQIQAISVNFGATTVSPSLEAGVEPVSNWNNCSSNGTYPGLLNYDGITTTASLSFSGNRYTTQDTLLATGDQQMMASHVGTLSTSFTLHFSGIPSDFVEAGYDLIAYFGAKDSSNYTPNFTLNGETLVIRDNVGTWDGVHRESVAQTAAEAVVGNNYVRFRNLSLTDFSLLVSKNSGAQRYGISGLQIVKAPSEIPGDPFPPTVRLRHGISGMELLMTSEVGKMYQLQKSSSLMDGWQDVGSALNGNGSSLTIPLPAMVGNREFYRVMITNP